MADRKLLIIHGVNYFRSRPTIRRVKRGLCGAPFTVEPFNWDAFMGHPVFDYEHSLKELLGTAAVVLNVSFLQELGGGLFASSQLDNDINGYTGMPKLAKWLGGVMNLAAGAVPFLLLLSIAAVITSMEKFWLQRAWRVIGVVVAANVFVNLIGEWPMALWVTMRRVVCSFAWPLLFLLTLPVHVVPLVWIIMAPLLFIGSIFIGHTQSTLTLWANIVGTFAGMGLGLGLIVRILYGYRRSPLPVAFKVVADVVRYLGLPDYRNTLRAALTSRLGKLLQDGPEEVVLLAHSMGTIIALDVLATGDIRLGPTTRLRLVTMGCPLQRLFHRFYPAFYPSPAWFRQRLHEFYPNLSWVNVWIPGDLIGESIDGIPNAKITPRRGPCAAHCAYFGSASAIRAAIAPIDDVPFHLSSEARLELPDHRKYGPGCRGSNRAAPLVNLATTMASWAGILLLVAWFVLLKPHYLSVLILSGFLIAILPLVMRLVVIPFIAGSFAVPPPTPSWALRTELENLRALCYIRRKDRRHVRVIKLLFWGCAVLLALVIFIDNNSAR